MALHSESVEQVQQDWQVRSAKKREELSRSIDETLADNALPEAPFSDEMDEAFQNSKYSLIIPPKLSLQSKSMPAIRVKSKDLNSITSPASTDSVVVPHSTQKKRRLAGRTTKVHLQAIPKSEKKSNSIASASLAGSGVVKQGEQDVMVSHTHISSSSVVIVTLVEDPGPVVVKFITLHPQVGFTLHFSDAAGVQARFNYVILL